MKMEKIEEKKEKEMLLTPEAMKMVREILGLGRGNRHQPEWIVLKNRLAGKQKPVGHEDADLLEVINELETARKVRKEMYDALPKCAKCGGAGPLGYNIKPGGKLVSYHYGQCSEGKKLTSLENAKRLREAMPKMKVIEGPFNLTAPETELPLSAKDLETAVKDAADILRIQDEMKAKDKEGAREIAKTKTKTENIKEIKEFKKELDTIPDIIKKKIIGSVGEAMLVAVIKEETKEIKENKK